ncbi:MAG: flavin reductase [Treponema sp.]|nr:flavin reductase [Treponema sp.]
MEFDSKHSVIVPEGVFIIGTYDENGVPNAMNAAWGIQSDYGEITLYLAQHKTTDNLKKAGAFTVAFGTRSTVTICDYFGIESGANVNKIEKAGVHVHKSAHVNAPVIEEFPLTLECEVKEWDEKREMLVGKIISQQADDSILTDGKIDLAKLQPIMFDASFHVYRAIGDVVAQAFSEGKKLK